jgi:hypothetical protein
MRWTIRTKLRGIRESTWWAVLYASSGVFLPAIRMIIEGSEGNE